MSKILVIEDETYIRENIIEILQLNNFECKGASGGKIGVELAQAYQPNLILCDVMMDEMDGYGVLREVRNHPETAHIPFVFLTAMADRQAIRRGLDAGADDYIVKPFSMHELLDVVSARISA